MKRHALPAALLLILPLGFATPLWGQHQKPALTLWFLRGAEAVGMAAVLFGFVRLAGGRKRVG